MSRTRMILVALAACAYALAGARPAAAQLPGGPTTYTWAGANGGAWFTTGNWTSSVANTHPGVANGVTLGNNVKDVATVTDGTTTNIGIDMSVAGATPLLQVGDMRFAGTGTGTFQLGNSSATVNGILQLNGAFDNVDPAPPIIIENNSTTRDFVLANTNTGSGTQTMGVRLGLVTSAIQVATGRTVTISSIVSQLVAGSQLQVGIPTNDPDNGKVVLTAANTFSGGVLVNVGPIVTGSGASGNAAVTITNIAGLGTGAFTVATTALTNTRVLDLNVNGVVANAFTLPTSGPTRLGIQTNNSTTAVTLSGKISGGYAGFTLFLDSGVGASAGVLKLSNTTNDFVGTVLANRGVIAITGDGVFGIASNALVLDQTSSNGGLRFDLNNITIAAARPVEFRSNFDINVNNFAATIASNVTGTNASTYNVKTAGSAGSLTLTGTNTTQAAFNVNNLTKLIVGSTTALGGTTGATTVSAGGTLAFNGIGTYANNETLVLNGAGIGGVGAVENLTGSNTFNGPITLGSSSFVGVTAGQLTLNSVISSATAAGVTKVGPGTLFPTGPSTYTGPTTISAGVLSVGIIPNGGASGPLGQSTAAAANLILDGGTLRFTGGSATTDRGFTANATGGTIDVTAGGADLTLSGGSAGAGGFTKSGAGTLTLTGTAANAGPNTVAAGVLSVGNGASGGTVTGDIINNAAVVINRADASTYAANLSGTGTVTKFGSGVLTLSGTNTYGGATTVFVGTVLVTGSLGATATTVASGATLGGTGTLGGTTDLSGGGTLAPGTTGFGTLTSSANVSLAAAGIFNVKIGADGVNDKLVVTGAGMQFNLATGTILKIRNPGGFTGVGFANYVIATLADGADLRVDGVTVPNGFIGEYKQGVGQSGPVAFDVSAFTLQADERFILIRDGNDLRLVFAPVPEPALVLGLAAIGLAVGRRVRRGR